MRRLKKERLKDIIIDHIYHYCFNEIVKKIKGDSANITLDVGSKLEDDQTLNDIYEKLIKPSKSINFSYDTRNATHCIVIEGKNVQKTFMDKLLGLGFKKSNKLHYHIESSLKFLLNRSYISQNQPIKTQYSLTQKGLNHYSSGKSFEESYRKGRNAAFALIISIISITLAITLFILKIIEKNTT
jgi:hypothetical protein